MVLTTAGKRRSPASPAVNFMHFCINEKFTNFMNLAFHVRMSGRMSEGEGEERSERRSERESERRKGKCEKKSKEKSKEGEKREKM